MKLTDYKKILESCELQNHKWQLKHFSEHKITETIVSDNFKIIEFKKEDSNSYSLRYIIDGGKLIVTGDHGEAVYRWFCNDLTIKELSNMNVHYFNGNCQTSSNGLKKWSSDVAGRTLEDYFQNNFVDKFFENSEIKETIEKEVEHLKKIKELFEELVENSHDELEYTCFVKNSSEVEDLLSDAHEWIYNVGNDIPMSARIHLLGLKLIQKIRDVEESEKTNNKTSILTTLLSSAFKKRRNYKSTSNTLRLDDIISETNISKHEEKIIKKVAKDFVAGALKIVLFFLFIPTVIVGFSYLVVIPNQGVKELLSGNILLVLYKIFSVIFTFIALLVTVWYIGYALSED